MSQDVATAVLEVRCEAGSVLSDVYCEEGRIQEAKQLLLKAMETSQGNHYWHCRLLFQAAVSGNQRAILNFTPLLTPRVNTLYCVEEWRGEQRI
jgi:hypothetical protein